MKEEEKQGNIIRIAGRDISIYVLNMVNLFNKYDQIEIQVTDQYVDRACDIIKRFEAMGILPTNGFPLKFITTEEDIVLRREQKKMRGHINRITLTKIPELFRFTKNTFGEE